MIAAACSSPRRSSRFPSRLIFAYGSRRSGGSKGHTIAASGDQGIWHRYPGETEASDGARAPVNATKAGVVTKSVVAGTGVAADLLIPSQPIRRRRQGQHCPRLSLRGFSSVDSDTSAIVPANSMSLPRKPHGNTMDIKFEIFPRLCGMSSNRPPR